MTLKWPSGNLPISSLLSPRMDGWRDGGTAPATRGWPGPFPGAGIELDGDHGHGAGGRGNGRVAEPGGRVEHVAAHRRGGPDHLQRRPARRDALEAVHGEAGDHQTRGLGGREQAAGALAGFGKTANLFAAVVQDAEAAVVRFRDGVQLRPSEQQPAVGMDAVGATENDLPAAEPEVERGHGKRLSRLPGLQQFGCLKPGEHGERSGNRRAHHGTPAGSRLWHGGRALYKPQRSSRQGLLATRSGPRLVPGLIFPERKGRVEGNPCAKN